MCLKIVIKIALFELICILSYCPRKKIFTTKTKFYWWHFRSFARVMRRRMYIFGHKEEEAEKDMCKN